MNIDIQTVFLVFAIISTIIFVLKVALPFDSGSEISSDFTNIADTDTSFNFFTFEGICAFFMSTGWMSWFSKAFLHYSTKISLIIGIFCGIAALFFYGWLISKIKKLEYIPTADKKELIGKTAKAYMQFAPFGQAQIEIEFNSKLEILDAKNNTDVQIQSFEMVKVVKVEDDIIYIEKL